MSWQQGWGDRGEIRGCCGAAYRDRIGLREDMNDLPDGGERQETIDLGASMHRRLDNDEDGAGRGLVQRVLQNLAAIRHQRDHEEPLDGVERAFS